MRRTPREARRIDRARRVQRRLLAVCAVVGAVLTLAVGSAAPKGPASSAAPTGWVTALAPEESGAGSSGATPLAIPSLGPDGSVLPGYSRTLLEVKLAAEATALSRGAGAVETVLARFPGATIERLFVAPADELDADLNDYYRVRLADGADAEDALAALNALGEVEIAYAAPLPSPAAALTTPSFVSEQGYRNSAPTGMDSVYAATVPGGRGANVTVLDIEYNWNPNHEDLTKAAKPGVFIQNGTMWDPFSDDNHGTAVFGVIAGDDNTFGVTGIAPDASLKRINQANLERGGVDTANALILARQNLVAGDVILIEGQVAGASGGCGSDQVGCVPPEWIPSIYDAIVAAVAQGIIVVESGGNGYVNLDGPGYGTPFPSSKPDSGAIITGSGARPVCSPNWSRPSLSRLDYSSHGTRVNLQAWGECVVTSGYGNKYAGAGPNEWYLGTFGGTSATGAEIAGAAAVLSSAAQARGMLLTSQQIRSRLVQTGTPQNTSGVNALSGNIGPMPELRGALATLDPAPGGFTDVLLNEPGLSHADNVRSPESVPPDATGAIGPSHYVEAVNEKVAVYGRAALAPLGTMELVDFVNPAAPASGHDAFHPQIQWDEQGGRWVYAADYVVGDRWTGDHYLAVGWSATADPTDLAGGWCRYLVPTEGGALGATKQLDDTPKLGHSDPLLVVGTNVYTKNGSSPAEFRTARVWTIGKPAAGVTDCPLPGELAVAFFGSIADPLKTSDDDIAFAPLPANTTESTADAYLVAADRPAPNASQVMVWKAAGPAATPTLTPLGNVAVASYSTPAAVPQPGTANVLDAGDARFTQAVLETDPSAGGPAFWTQHTVAGVSGRTQVRWYEILPALPGLREQGAISDAAHSVFNGAVSPAANGTNAAITYTVGSATLAPQIRARTGIYGNASSTIEGEVVLGSSAGSAADASCTDTALADPPRCRWGAYAGLGPDPVNPSVVWGTSQLLLAPDEAHARWTTRNFSIRVGLDANVGLALTDSPDPIVAGADLTYTLTVTNAGPLAAANVQVFDTLPLNATLIQASTSQGAGCTPTTTLVTCALGSLAKDASATVTIVVRPSIAGAVTNGAYVTSTSPDLTSDNNGRTVATTVQVLCNGLVATVVGTDAANVLSGTAGNDVIAAFGGDDTISGSGGDDTICTGAGSDIVIPGAGNDTVIDETGVDEVRFTASSVPVTVDLAAGTATGEGTDTLSGIENATGSIFADVLIGDDGPNRLAGGSGNDILQPGGGNDDVLGESGSDTVRYWDAPGGVTVNLVSGTATGDGSDTLSGIENVNGSDFADFLYGSIAAETLVGRDGDDLIHPGGGNDSVDGSGGFDTVDYQGAPGPVVVELVGGSAFGDGNDSLAAIEGAVGSSYSDQLTGNESDNLLVGGFGDDLLFPRGGNDTANGSGGVDVVSYAGAAGPVTVDLAAGTGGVGAETDLFLAVEGAVGASYADRLTGNDGANILRGGGGNDLLIPAGGQDALDGQDGTDTVSFADAPHGVKVDLLAGSATGDGTDALASLENVEGSGFADVLRGGNGRNVLSGGAGKDVLDGRLGRDVLRGGTGIDRAIYRDRLVSVRVSLDGRANDGAARERDNVAKDVEDVDGGRGADVLRGSSAANRLRGFLGDDRLYGLGGSDRLLGAGGNDTFDGGSGRDTCSQGSGSGAMLACER